MIPVAIASLGWWGRDLAIGVRDYGDVVFRPMHIFRPTLSTDPGRLFPVTPRAIETRGFRVRIANMETGG
jgi:hypothetical protein